MKGISGFSVVWRALVAVAVLSSCSVAARFSQCFADSATSVTSTNTFDFSGVDEFGLRLFRELVPAGSTDNSNLLMSPYSIWSVLSLALMGAQGSTRLQLEAGLGLPSTKRQAFKTKYALNFLMAAGGSGPVLRMVDRAYFDKSLPLRPCVPRMIMNVETIDFSKTADATAKINQDISRGTGGHINDFLNPSALTNAVFVLLNAVYFKGTWEKTFNTKDTNRQVFYSSRGDQVATVDMMTQTGKFNIVQSPALGATMLELPYGNSNISMLVLLPDINNPTIDGVLKALSPYTLSQALKARRELNVKISFPKFDLKTEIETELVQALKTVGISDMFNPARANFSDFTSSTPLFADTAIHQAKVAVDEEGTVASAVTVIVGTRSGPGQVYEFIVNRPFVFLIYEKRTKVTLFAGVVRNPSK